MRFTSIAEAIAFVESFASPPVAARDPLPPRERQAARLPHMAELLGELGDPQNELRVAHVTGTSGKGSTATMLAAIAHAAGLHVGAYINPYITRPQERVQIDGADMDDDAFIAAASEVAAALDVCAVRRPDRRPHLKQVWVALALVALRREHVDLVAIEVGMGGRFDETNLVRPVVSVITTIGFDHREFLGDTLADIAWHKAGIIKPSAPAITGASDPLALAVIRAEAERAGVPLIELGRDVTITDVMTDRAGTRFTYRDEDLGSVALATPLIGAHQAHNAALAVRAARVPLPGIDLATIRRGLASAWLPGRFEIVAERPTVVLDAAHNPDKLAALVTTLRATLTWDRLIVVFGALGSKEAGPMLAALAPLTPRVILTAPAVAGRIAAPPMALASAARAAGISDIAIESEPLRAVDRALDDAAPGNVVVVTGSLFLVSQVRPRWRG